MDVYVWLLDSSPWVTFNNHIISLQQLEKRNGCERHLGRSWLTHRTLVVFAVESRAGDTRARWAAEEFS